MVSLGTPDEWDNAQNTLNTSWDDFEDSSEDDESGGGFSLENANNWLAQGTQLISGANTLFSMFNGGNGFLSQNNNNNQPSPQQQDEARRRAEEARKRAEEEERKRKQNNNTTLKYVGIGVAIVTIGGLIVWAVSSSNSDKK